jgi:hypothetical protein
MAQIRDIKPPDVDDTCDVCGRTLLRGEVPEHFLAGGQRRTVCELCTTRAQHEGWIRESGADEIAPRNTRHEGRGRSFLERLRARRERARELHADAEAASDPQPTPAGGYELQEPRRPRHVRAVPTNADLKMQRALEVFNGSEHVRTVAGVARSLGAPEVGVRPLPERPSVVVITVMWELSWYRFEVDLSDEAGGVRRDAQGDELSELIPEEQVVNATADERGALHLGVNT